MRAGLCVIVAVAFSAFGAVAIASPLSIEVASGQKEFPPFSQLRVSPDGKYVAFVIRDERRVKIGLPMSASLYFSKSGVPRVIAYVCDIYVADLRTGKVNDITSGRYSNWAPAWSRRGDNLAFVSDRDGRARLWIWQSATQRIRRASSASIIAAQQADRPVWVNADKGLVLKTLPAHLTFEGENQIISMAGHINRRFDSQSSVLTYDHTREPLGISSATQRLEGYQGHLAPPAADLSLINVASGAVQMLVRCFSGNARGVDFRSGYLLLSEESHVDSGTPRTEIVILDLRSRKKLRILTVPESPDAKIAWSPAGSQFTYVGRVHNEPLRLALVIAGARRSRVSTIPLEKEASAIDPSSIAWTRDGRTIVGVVGNDIWEFDAASGVSRLVSAATPSARKMPHLAIFTQSDGDEVWQMPNSPRSVVIQSWDPQTFQQRVETVNLDTGSRRNISVTSLQYSSAIDALNFDASTSGGSATFVAWDETHPPDVWTTDSEFHRIHRLTDLNPRLANIRLGKSEVITWTSTDGKTMQGTLLLPSDYVAGRKYPTIIWQRAFISGPYRAGMYGLFGDLSENWQILATRGYAILAPDFPTASAADIKTLTTTDLLPACDELVASGIADPNKLGITGESLGGAATIAIISLTNRFRAAVSTVGDDNEFNVATMLLPSGDAFRLDETERWIGGTPWSNRDGYIAASPFFSLDRIRTPLLIIASRDKITDTMPQYFTDDAFVGLRSLNRTVEYALYSGGHGPFAFSYADRVDFWYRILYWFDRYLK